MELYINDILVDLGESIAFPLTYQISDVRNIEARKGNSSKTIALPDTAINRALMSEVFMLTTTDSNTQEFDDFDPAKKASVRCYDNGLLIFKGVCQLVDCYDDAGVWTFNVVLFSDQRDYFADLKNYKLRELGWSEYNHNLTAANQKNSWSGTIKKNGVNYNNYSGVNWLGEGYYYGLIDYGYDRPSDNSFETIHIAPQIFAKSILDKMFSLLGVTVDSDFFDSQQFKRLLLAWEGGELPTIKAAEATQKSVETDQLNNNGSYIFDIQDISTSQSASWSPYYDTYNGVAPYLSNDATDVDPSGQIQSHEPLMFVPNTNGIHTVNYSGTLDVDFTVIPNGVNPTDTNANYVYRLFVYKNGSLYQSHLLSYGSDEGNTGTSISFTDAIDYSFDLSVEVSDVIEFRFKATAQISIDTDNESPQYDLQYAMTNGALDLSYQQQELSAGAVVNIGWFLPDMTCYDFLKGIITAHNMYVQQDPDDLTKLKIEPLNSFYNGSNNAVDWSDYVDRSKRKIVTPTVNLTTESYQWLFADDKDYWNNRYTEDVDEQYGSKLIKSPSQFVTGETKFKLPFSNKLLAEIPDTDLILPRSFTVKTQDGVNEITPKRGKSFLVQIKKGNVGTLQTGDWVHIDETDTDNNETSYPYVGHLDDIDNPTFDLMFNIPNFVYYDIPAGINYTTNNLYTYHEKFIRELVSKHGKMLTCYINLNSELINSLSFRDLINIDGVVYRLNKVQDYDSDLNRSTLCEFVKILEGESLQTYTVDNEFDPYLPPSKGNVRATESGDTRITEDGEERII